MTFPAVKLLDYRSRWDMLEASRNPFAIVVMTHLKTQETRQDTGERRTWKLMLTRRLYEQGYDREDILQLFRLIDWMMQLPEELQQDFMQELYEYEEGKKMPYITSVERLGIEKGLREGELKNARKAVREVLAARFTSVPRSIIQRVNKIDDLEVLNRLLRQAATTDSLEEFRRGMTV